MSLGLAIDCATLPILGELEPALLERLLTHCRIVTFDEREIILHKDAENQYLHFILSGRAQVHFDLSNRTDPIDISPGQMFGEMSVIDQMPVSAYVIAAESCRILLLPAALFWSEVVAVPGVARSVMRSLSRLIRNSSAALIKATQDRLRHAALESELRLARDIQMGMLRRADPWFPERQDFRISARIEPARLVGGDFYDAFLLDPDHLVLAIGDVAGKGISAAMFMVRALTLLRGPATHWVSLAKTLEDANRELAENNELSMFLTLFMGVLDLRTGELEYVNFSHPRPLIRSPDGAVSFYAVEPGIMLGVFSDAEGAAGRLVLPPGATLLLYSDGVTDAEDRGQRQLRASGLLEAVTMADTDDTGAVVQAIADTISRHAGEAEQVDDITLLAITYRGRT